MLMLNCVDPGSDVPVSRAFDDSSSINLSWLHAVAELHPQAILFFTIRTETTDIFEHEEPEIDYNTVVISGDDGSIRHTYATDCPSGCYGQLDDCVYKQERWHTNDPLEGRVHDTRITDQGFEADIELFCTGEPNCPGRAHANDCPKWEA